MSELPAVLQIHASKAKMDEHHSMTLTLTIQSEEEYQQAADFLMEITDRRRDAETQFGKVYDPLWKAVMALRAQRTSIFEPWDRAEAALRSAMAGYREAEEARRVETLQEIEQTIASGVPLTETLPPMPAVPAEPTGITYRDQWSANVTDLLALAGAVAAGEAPADCVQPNMTRLNALARALRDDLHIPGVESVSRKVVQVRRA